MEFVAISFDDPLSFCFPAQRKAVAQVENTNGAVMSHCTAQGFRLFFASAVVFYAFCRVQGMYKGFRMCIGDFGCDLKVIKLKLYRLGDGRQ